MFAVLYRWSVRAGHEEQFTEAWTAMTVSIREQCGSFGSRLHRSADGTWVAYALWPDEATWQACTPDDREAGAAMAAAIEEDHEPLRLDVVTDLLSPGDQRSP